MTGLGGWRETLLIGENKIWQYNSALEEGHRTPFIIVVELIIGFTTAVQEQVEPFLFIFCSVFMAIQWSAFVIALRHKERARVFDAKQVPFLILFSLLAFPIALFVLVNAFVVSGRLLLVSEALVVSGVAGLLCGIVLTLRNRIRGPFEVGNPRRVG